MLSLAFRLDWFVWWRWSGNSCCLNRLMLPFWCWWFGFAAHPISLEEETRKPQTHKKTVTASCLCTINRIMVFGDVRSGFCIILHTSTRDFKSGWGEGSKMFFLNILSWALMVFHLATGDRKACFVKGLLFFTDTVQFTSANLVAEWVWNVQML